MTAILLTFVPGVRGNAATPTAPTHVARYQLNIARVPLNSALKDFAIQTGLQVARFSDGDVGVRLVGPLVGGFTAAEAMDRLLAGSGVTFRLINPTTIAIVPSEAAASHPLSVPNAPTVNGEAPADVVETEKPAPRSAPAAATQSSDAHRGFFARLAAIFAICTAATAMDPACAQEAAAATPVQNQTLEEVVVTGTSIRGVAPTGSELIAVSRDDIEATAATTGTELLRSLPQMNNFNATGLNTGSNQAGFVDQPAIHGIGVGNGGAGLTLVLFDGHRLPGAGINQTAPDAGVIPTSAIERVEVMADGGSSIYGSDAIAGVVNFLPRRNFNGAETSARSGFGDGYHTDNFSQLLGKTWDSGSILLDYEYSANSALNGRNRSYVLNNQAPLGGPDSRSNVCTPANISAGGTNFALSAAGAVTAGATNLCESNRANDLYPRQWRNQFYLALRQQLGDNVELYASSVYSGRTIQDHVAGAGVTSGNLSVTVPSTSPFYIPLPGVPAGTPESVSYDPASDFGPFANQIRTTTSSTVAGADINLGRQWSAHVEFNYGLEHDNVDERGIDQALARSAADAGTFNPYGVGPATSPSVLASIGSFNTNYFGRQVLEEGQFKLDGPIFDMPGGPVKAAVGFDARHEEFDGRTSAGDIGTAITPYTADGKRNSTSGFVELFFPLVSDRNHFAGVQKLSVSVSGRYDHYSDVGGTTNPKLGLNWTPVAGVLVRASAGRSFHAPSLADAPTAIDTRAIRFPCISGAFIGCLGATPSAYTVILAGGNTLKPETARTYNFGIDLAPEMFAGLKASLTYFRVDYKDVITFPTFGPVTNPAEAYDRYRILRPAGIPDAQWLAIVQPLLAGFRHDGSVYPDDPNLPSAVYDLRRQNFANERINGLDYDLGYRFDTAYGKITADIAGTQFMTFYQQIPGSANTVPLLDTNYAVRSKVRGELGWSNGDYAASLFVSYTGRYNDVAVSPFTQVGSFITTDVHIAWSLPQDGILSNLRLTLDANNLFDKRPPIYFTTGANGIVGFDPGVASALGRVVSVGLHKSW